MYCFVGTLLCLLADALLHVMYHNCVPFVQACSIGRSRIHGQCPARIYCSIHNQDVHVSKEIR